MSLSNTQDNHIYDSQYSIYDMTLVTNPKLT